MESLESKIKFADSYKAKFESWEASTLLIDDDKEFWQIKNPKSSVEKVCLFRDNRVLCIYGDYGSYTFDRMTWTRTPWNLRYDNLDYMAEKLSVESSHAVRIFSSTLAERQFLDWVQNYLKGFDANENFIEKAMEFLRQSSTYSSDVDDLYDKIADDRESDYGNYEELYSFLCLCIEALSSMEDEISWQYFLQNSDNAFQDVQVSLYDEPLYRFGMEYSQRYLISLYALKILSQKLENPHIIK
jgi:hypothetical protein